MSEAAEDVLARMRGDWDRRAAEDHKLHIATGHSGSEESFRSSGEMDLDAIVLDGVVLRPSAEVLEIGCGVGRLLFPLASRVAVAHGVDISPVMIEKSKEYAAGVSNVRTVLTDGSFAHLSDSSIDFVYSFIVFQHIPERAPIRRYVEEAARVLKPGGVFRFQVDGRWWWTHGVKGPDTYDGVKFSPDEVRGLLAGTPLATVDEWGAEGHYHWITARKRGEGAAVALAPRGWDLLLFESLLRRLGSSDPADDAAAIRSGSASLRPHLLRLVERLSAERDSAFVGEAYRTLLGRALDGEGHAYHLAILTRDFEDREALLDTITTSREFLDLHRPHVPEMPWLLSFEVLGRLGQPPRVAGFFELVEASIDPLKGLSPRDAIVSGFRIALGFEPDEAAIRHHLAIVENHPDGLRLFMRALLASRLASPLALGGAARTDLLPEESEPREADRAANLLREGASLEPRGFVRLAYERIFGREADSGGEEFYVGKLTSGEMSRPSLLFEFFRSEEGRGRLRRSH